MAELTLLDLVHNGTMDHHLAATIWTIAEERRSFVVMAVPRFAGKTTVSHAMLRFVPSGTPVHHLSGDEAEVESLRANPDGGYLVVGEFSRASVSNYIWGEPVRKVFETMREGFPLATALHAATVEEAFSKICDDNGVPDRDASLIDYVIYIERKGTDLDDFWRRIAAVHEVDRVVNGMPSARLLHRWNEADDSFERVEQPRLLSVGADGLQARAARIRQMVDAGRTSDADIDTLIAAG